MPNPDAWIIESKVGIWLTTKVDVAEKQDKKPGTIITPYFSKRTKEIEPNEQHQTGLGPGSSAGGNEAVPPVEAAA